MAAPASRQQLLDYCLRKLGHPVTEINVDDDQLEDRLDDAFQYYRDYHYDGVERIYMPHRVTASNIYITSSIAGTFQIGDILTGLTSGAKAEVTEYNVTYTAGTSSSQGTSIVVQGLTATSSNGGFIVGEVISASKSLVTATVASVTIGDIDNKWIPVDDGVIGVARIMPFSATNTGLDYMFDLRYQLRLNDLFDLMSTSIIYYQQIKAHLDMLDMLLVGEKSFRFQRHMGRLYIDMRWGSDVRLGETILVECYRVLDPDQWTEVYNDRFLKRYATALIKRQWGENLKKFDNIQMPGGVTLNGQKIWDEAMGEISFLENEMESSYQEPPNFMVG